jgi:hypothetical protein
LFTINRPGRPSEPRRCLRTTNRIDTGYSVLRDRVRRVKNGPNGTTALCATAVAFDAIAKGFRRIMRFTLLWMLKAAWTSLCAISRLSTRPRPDSLESSRGRQPDLPLSLGQHPSSKGISWIVAARGITGISSILGACG